VFRLFLVRAAIRVIIKQGLYHCKDENDDYGIALFYQGEWSVLAWQGVAEKQQQ
jgi:hypothetical protein